MDLNAFLCNFMKAWKGSSAAHSNLETNVVSLPSGFSKNSSVIKTPAKHFGIGAFSMSYNKNSIMPNPNKVSQPRFVHDSTFPKVDFCANDVSTYVATASIEQRSICAQPSLGLVNLQHPSSTGKESLIPKLITIPVFPSQN